MENSVDVSGLPESYVRAVQAVVETFRRQIVAERGEKTREASARPPVELPRWPLGVIGNLTREEIYDDRV